jgi:DnaK suppressor protein
MPGTTKNIDFKPYKLKKGEAYMNNDQLAHFRSILEKMRQELMEEVDNTVQHLQEEPGHLPDPNDQASREEEFNLELRTRNREGKLIHNIESALERINLKDYGYCDVCNEEIGLKRLEARPTAKLCIDCKTIAEVKEKQFAEN